MRRLKRDWNEHGWNWLPRPYNFLKWGLSGVALKSPWADTTLCDCFYDPKAMARFKDTPKGCSCAGCGNPRKWFDGRSREALTLQERVANIGDREEWSIRKRRKGTHRKNLLCGRCGRLVGSVMVPNGAVYGTVRSIPKCEKCQ